MHRLESNLGASVDHRSCVHLYAHCRHGRALELVRIDEQSHGGDAERVACAPSHRKSRRVLDHVSTARRIRHVDRQARVIDLDEVRQRNLEMTVFGLVEAESVVNGGHRGHDIVLLCHRRVLLVHQDEDADLPGPDDVLARLDVGGLCGLTLREELEEKVNLCAWF